MTKCVLAEERTPVWFEVKLTDGKAIHMDGKVTEDELTLVKSDPQQIQTIIQYYSNCPAEVLYDRPQLKG